MYEGCSVGVVVPGHDEEGFIGSVIDTVPSFVDALYVVDDCSTDGTWAEIQDRVAEVQVQVDGGTVTGVDGTEVPEGLEGPEGPAGPEGPPATTRIVTFRHRRNRGRGGAVKTGYRAALTDGLDVVAVMDGDGQMDPEILEEIVEPVVREEADYVVGDRLSDPALRASMPRFRLFGNLLLTALTRVASGYWSLSDPQNGYTAISRRALAALDLDALYDDYGFLNDLLVRLHVRGFRVTNVRMPARYGEETSGIRYSTFVPKLSLLLCRLYLYRLVLWRLGATGGRSPEGGEPGAHLTRRESVIGLEADEPAERVDEL